MAALPVIAINAESTDASPRRAAKVAGACLFLILMFCTATVFVREAWALQSFQIGIFLLLAVYLLIGVRGHAEQVASGWIPQLIYFIPVWGIQQLLFHTTASTIETRTAVLRWGALAGVFFLIQIAAPSRAARRHLLTAFLVFATSMAVLCLLQLFTSGGLVLWIFSTGYPDVYGTFPSYNSYAQFVELALPIALWRGLREGWRSWWYALAGGLLYGSVIGSASRAGATLCTAELIAMLLIGLIRLRDRETGLPTRSTTTMLVMVPVLAATFTLAVGWQRVWERFLQNDPYLVRKEFMLAAVDMAAQHPLVGYGLDTFPEVYQRYAIKDFPFYANHTHNDWAEFAADGGFPFLLLILIPFAAAVPTALRHPWALGLISVMLHGCIDFPFPRPAVSGWMFFLLGLIYMASRDEKRPGAQKLSQPTAMSAVTSK